MISYAVTIPYHWLGIGALVCLAVGFLLAVLMAEG